MKKIALLGSTGSIGRQVIDVVRAQPGMFAVTGLAAHSNIELLKRQIEEFRPRIASIWDEARADELRAWCRRKGLRTEIGAGLAGLNEVARHPAAGMLLSAVVGAIGLEPVMNAILSGKDIALANKEALVVAGDLVMAAARTRGVKILPVDSEHSAIFQCLKNEDPGCVKRLILTASGGPLYRSTGRQSAVDVKTALAHPTWIMGPKITIDSATLMNKGLEAIEAHHLFAMPFDRIDIVIHPQSIVHSLVEYVDGSVIAQLSNPDMRLPIQHALLYPARIPSPVRQLDLARVGHLEFAAPDFRRFPCLGLALEAGRTGGTMPALMNAANEVAVHAFLKGALPFANIADVVETMMGGHRVRKNPGLQDLLAVDQQARTEARELIAGKAWRKQRKRGK
jgi:1-deoxy-D-xylulose-5-phosphate reductoisomerase